MQRKSSPTIKRYIYGELFFTSTLCTLVLTLLLLYGNMNRHHEELLLALSLNSSLFTSLILLLVPYAFSLALPFGFSLSVLFCVGKWSSDREIIAMDSLGFSKLNWFKPTILCALFISFFAAVIILHWAPQARFQFEQKKEEVMWSGFDSMVNKGDAFNFKLGSHKRFEALDTMQSFTGEEITKLSVNIGSKNEDYWENLRILAWGEIDSLLCILHAKRADVTKDIDQGKVSLELFDVDIEKAENFVDGHQKHSSFISFKRWNSPLVLNLSDQTKKLDSPKMLPINQLLQKIRTSGNSAFVESASAVLFKNTMLAFSPLILSFVLIPIGVSKPRKESSSQLVLGIIICILFYASGVMFYELIGGSGWGWWFNGIIFLILGITKSLKLLDIWN
jgi:lipopolysaccharide export LptBFGC system permease protein LptF